MALKALTAKPKVFVSYDHSEDANYKRLLQAWDANPDFDFEILAVGYQATHNRATWFRPISLSYQKEPSTPAGVLSSGPRWFRHTAAIIGVCPAAHLALLDVAALSAKTRACEGTEDMARAYVEAVQQASTWSDTIGGDCISIEIDCPAKPKPEVRVRFTPRPDRPEADPRRTPVKSTALSFSPWIIGPEVSTSPKVFSVEGWLCHPLGRYEVKMRGTDVTVPVFKVNWRWAWLLLH